MPDMFTAWSSSNDFGYDVDYTTIMVTPVPPSGKTKEELD